MTPTGVYKANEVLYNAFIANGFNTVTFGDITQVDLNKQTIFPLCHISLTSSDHTPNTMVLNYEGVIVDAIDSNNLDPREMLNKFLLTSNIEDVLHDLNYNFAKAIKTLRNNLDDNITIPDTVSIDVRYDEGQNKLAGYYWTLSITMRGNNIC